MEVCYIATPIGWAELKGNEKGLCSVRVLDTTPEVQSAIPETLLEAVVQLKAYFNKELSAFNLKLNPEGTEFEKTVWEALRQIPYGKTISYLHLAKQLNNPKAIRAIARANGKNPLWIIIPCHRVIGSDGSLTGYAGGLHRKQWLLEHESSYKQQKLF